MVLQMEKKLLKYVDTRWISLKEWDEKLYDEYASLVGVMYENRSSVEKYQTPLFLLIDIETLLTLTGIIHMLHEMNNLMKMAQSHMMYIAEYTREIKLTCLALDNLYIMPVFYKSIIYKLE